MPDNSRLQFAPRACYEIESTLYIHDRNNLLFNDSGATFLAKTIGSGTTADPYLMRANWPVKRAQWWIHGGTNIVLENMIIHGAANLEPEGTSRQIQAKYIGQYGVAFAGVNGGVVENSVITDTYSDLVGVLASDPSDTVNPQPSQNIAIINNHLERADRDGPLSTTERTLSSITTTPATAWGPIVDMEPVPTRWLVNNVRVTNNVAGPHSHYFIAAAGSSLTNDNLDIENNQVTGGTLDISIGSTAKNPAIRHNIRIIDNRADMRDTSSTGMIQVRGIDGVTISGNQAPVRGTAVGLDDSSNVVIVGNSFPGASPW